MTAPVSAPSVYAAGATNPSATSATVLASSDANAYRGHGLDGPVLWLGGQRVHSLSERGRDVMKSMSDWAGKELPRYLRADIDAI